MIVRRFQNFFASGTRIFQSKLNEAFKAQIGPKVDEATLTCVPHPLTDGDTAEGALVPIFRINDFEPFAAHRVRSSCWRPAGKCASWPAAGAPAIVRAGESTTVAGADVIALPVTMICPIMKGCGVQV